MYSVAFILALLAFGGLAAYLGDVLGYRLGKRRLSLLHLRPRTTARLVGVVVGLLIPAVTVLISSLLVPYVKDALFRIDSLHRQIGTLSSERDTMAQQRDSLRRQAKQQRQAAQQARANANQSRSDLVQVKRRLGEARDGLAAARSQVTRLRTQAGRLQADRTAAVRELGQAQRTLRGVEDALRAAEQGLDRARKSVVDAQDANTKLEAERKSLEAQTVDLRQSVGTLRDQLATVKAEWELDHTLSAAVRPVLDLETELVRGVIRRPAGIEALTDDLVALLVLADAAAEAAGAGKGDNGRYVRVVRPIPLTRQWDPNELPPEEAVLGFVRKLLWEDKAEEHVLRVIVDGRAFRNEQVNVRFEARANELVFAQGQTLVTRKLPAQLEEVDAFEQLFALIADPDRSEVRKQAQAARMLPNPRSGRYGEVTVRELYEAAHECAGRPGPVTVKVQAAADAYTVGPLSVKVVVEPAEGGGP